MIIIPIGHEARVQRFPYVTVGLIVLNFLIFLPTWYSERDYMNKMNDIANQITQMDPFYFNSDEAKNNTEYNQIQEFLKTNAQQYTEEKAKMLQGLVAEFQKLNEERPLYRWGLVPSKWKFINVITAMFLHGGWLHLIGNMLFLWMVGCNIEDRWGPWFFGAFYIIGGIVAGASDALSRLSSDMPAIGASGAVGAVMGAFMVRYAATKIRFGYIWFFGFYPKRGTFSAPAYVTLPIWFLKELFWGVSGFETGVAHWAHIGGFAFGAATGLVMWLTGIEKKYFIPRYSLDGEEHTVPESYKNGIELLGQGKRDEARHKLVEAAALEGGYLPAFVSLSKIYADDKNQAELIKTTEEIVKLALAGNEPQIAYETFQRFMKVFPDASLKPMFQFRMATTLRQSGMFQEAAWAYRNLATTYPNDAMAQKSLLASADILSEKLGMPENAIQMYEYLTQYYPGGPMEDAAKRGIAKAKKALGAPIS